MKLGGCYNDEVIYAWAKAQIALNSQYRDLTNFPNILNLELVIRSIHLLQVKDTAV